MLKKLLSLLTLSILTACFGPNYARHTVKITNMSSNSGGSGSIVHSEEGRSLVLTNAHVCGVVKQGGLVHTEYGGTSVVISYKKSRFHDLCLIEVKDDLGSNLQLATSMPTLLDKSVVAGHPHLLPLMVTEGHFSGRDIVPVMTGIRSCNEDEFKNPGTGIFCFLLGGLPVITLYEAQAVSNLIQPGSSGSAVYNSSGEIAAVIFAGQGEIGYGWAVPYEYIKKFLIEEISFLKPIYPDPSAVEAKNKVDAKTYRKKALEICEKTKNIQTLNVCSAISKSAI